MLRRYIDKEAKPAAGLGVADQYSANPGFEVPCDANDGLLVKSFASLSDEDMLQLQKGRMHYHPDYQQNGGSSAAGSDCKGRRKK